MRGFQIELILIMGLGAGLRFLIPGVIRYKESINRIVLHVLWPFIVFVTVGASRVDKSLMEMSIVAGFSVIGCLFIGALAFNLFRMHAQTRGALIIGSSFGNAIYIGLPVLYYIFPNNNAQMSEAAVFYDIGNSFLNLSLGVAIAIWHGGNSRASGTKIISELIKLPLTWSVLLGLMWQTTGIPLPAFVIQSGKMLSEYLCIVMLLLVGAALSLRGHRPLMPIILSATIKLAVSPAIAFLTSTYIGLAGIYRDAVVLEAAMPSQLLSLVIARRYGLDDETLAFVIIINTILSIFLIDIVAAMLGL